MTDEWMDPDRGDWRQQEDNEAQRFHNEKGRTMGFKVSNKGGGDFEQPPAGNHIARCIRVVDLGTQKTEWKGKQKLVRKMFIGWELLGTTMEDGRPFITTQRYTASLGDKAKLRADLESWRGMAFTPQQLEGFDLKNILGKPCMVNLVPSDDGKYMNVKAITPLPSGITAPAAENEAYLFSLDEFDATVFAKLSERVQETIKASPEYQELTTGHKPDDPHPDHDDDDDDSIPF
jgi:hypothetical protein